MGDVVAGLAGGLPLADIRFAGSEGFGDANHQELYVATPNGNESDWDKAIVESLIQEHTENDSRPAITMEDLRQLAATPAATSASADAADEDPEQSQTCWKTVPMKIGLSIPAVLHIVDQVIAGAPMEDVLTRLGGKPGSRWRGKAALRGDDWLAEGYSRGWKIEVVTPERENGEWLCFDKRQLADYAWRIAQALEQCYGSPYGMRTGNHGFFDRLFRVGNHGIEVGNSPLAVEVKIGSFDKLAELWCW